MNHTRHIFLFTVFIMTVSVLSAQESDRRDVRRGNRNFKDGDFRESVVDYQKALLRDSTSFAAAYNMANAIYRLDNVQEARKILDSLDAGTAGEYASDYYYNLGNMALAQKDYGKAVDAYRQSLLRNPDDLDAKENYIYAKKKLEDQQNQDQDNDRNQDQNQNNDNQDNKDDQDKDNRNNQDDQNNGNGQDRQDQGQDNQSGQQPQLTRQAAQQMMNAILAKEKETQDKVKKEKAAVMKSKQKEKNW